MTDRELLEKAARAAGMVDAEYKDMEGWGEVRHGFAAAMWCESQYNKTGSGYWCPLEDDGDAARLAIDLGLRVATMRVVNGVNATFIAGNDGRHINYEAHGTDPYAATRRAIVRAAASMGE